MTSVNVHDPGESKKDTIAVPSVAVPTKFKCQKCKNEIASLEKRVICSNNECKLEYCSTCINRTIGAKNKGRTKKARDWTCWHCGERSKYPLP